MANENLDAGPSRGQAELIQNKTEVATNGVGQLSGLATSNLMGAAPGTVTEQSRRDSIVIGGLGNLYDEPKTNDNASSAIGADVKGEGDRVVVLVDYVSAPNGGGFVKGSVRFISLFVEAWGDETKADAHRKQLRRLFDTGSIRLATSEEAAKSQIEVTSMSETSDVQNEREARIRAERETESLRLMLSEVQKARELASPQSSGNGQAGEQNNGNQMPKF